MSDSPAIVPRTVVFVLGMHRTGTSVTTAILNALGVSLSEDLMPPTQFNAKGYFESIAISSIHDEILKAMGSSWSTSELFVPFPQNWWRLPQIAPFKRRLMDQVSRELERVSGIWGFKDPRTARLLPLWKEIVAELRLDPRYVLVVRDPLDVAKSLQARENVPGLVSELLWLEHYTDAIQEVGPDRFHAIVEYGRWFDAPLAQARELISGLGAAAVGNDNLEAVLARTISGELRHHSSVNTAYALPFSRELFQALKDRNTQAIGMFAELFHVAKVFSQKMVGLSRQSSAEQLQDVQHALHASRQRIVQLENRLRETAAP